MPQGVCPWLGGSIRIAKGTALGKGILALLAAPGPGQDAGALRGRDGAGGNVQYVDCSQVQNAVQGQYGDATAIGNKAVAAIANEQDISQNQVNACLGNIGQNPNGNGGGNNGGDNGGGGGNTTNDADPDCA